MKTTKISLILLAAFLAFAHLAVMAQTNDTANPPAAKAPGKRRAKGDELEKVTAMFKKEVQRDRLPGLPDKSDFELKADMNDAKDLVTFEAHPKDNDFVYHYQFAHAPTKKAWKLKKAWRTDKENHVKEYPVETAEN